VLTVAVGDIHGMAGKLDQLLDLVGAYLVAEQPGERFRFVFLGDYVDRGPQSRVVLDRVRALQREGAVCLRGNHEDLMIRSIETDAGMRTFLHNGGVQTVASFATLETFLDAIEWMTDLPLTYEDDHRLFVHAGVRPDVPLEAQSADDLLWIRRPLLDFPGPFPKYIVHGHSPTFLTPGQGRRPHILRHRCNLDTGAVYGGPLTAAVFSNDQPTPIAVLSTDPQPSSALA
jgi:serine/threonine protein phosphatase 1